MPTLPAALAGITNHLGSVVRLVCGPDATYDLLLMEVYFASGRWWLSGYDEGELTELLVVAADEVTGPVVVVRYTC